MASKQAELRITALYERLSRDDELMGDSNSIVNQLILWRSAWADIVNLHLERIGSEERVDHRSHAERGLDEQPTIHEGVAARAMEKKGVISDRCELNRQIKADNALLRELKDLVAMLTEFVADAASSITDQLTKLREKLIVICYQIKIIIRSMGKRTAAIQATQPKLKRYNELTQQIRQKSKARKALVAEQKNTSKLNLIKQHDLSQQITTLTEEIEELRSEKRKPSAGSRLCGRRWRQGGAERNHRNGGQPAQAG